MDSTAVREIAKMSLDASQVKEIDGVKYTAVELMPVVDTRSPLRIELSSLNGFASFVNEYDKPGLIVVADHHNVVYLSEERPDRDRFQYAIVTLPKRDCKFNFDHFYDHEDFIIKLRSLFTKTDDREKLMQFASRLVINDSVNVEDDGVTQQVKVKKGMSGALQENQSAPSIVSLAPFRTFTEVDQPESDFLFRMRTYGGTPECSLFLADGGAWREEAMINIAEYLNKNITNKQVQVIV